jgi:hypothetical protein
VIVSEPLLIALPSIHKLAARKSISMCELRHEFFVMWDRQQTSGIAQSILELCAERISLPYGRKNSMVLNNNGFSTQCLPLLSRCLCLPRACPQLTNSLANGLGIVGLQ